MACITISGYPCSGKSYRAEQLKKALEERLADPQYTGPKLKVHVLSDEEINVSRNAYDESRLEKPARSAMLTAVTRHFSKDTILIIDGMNYIKGYRYQIYCAAREAGIRVCTLFVVATADMCRERNMQREESSQYVPSTFDNLIMRFEEPSSMVRWDSPLFTIPWDEQVPVDDIWKAIISGEKRPPNQAVAVLSKAPTDALQTLEQTSGTLVQLILSAQSHAPAPGGLLTLTLPPSIRLQLTLPSRNITLSELQRVKRQFVSVHKRALTQGLAGKGDLDWSEETIARKFISYLEETLN